MLKCWGHARIQGPSHGNQRHMQGIQLITCGLLVWGTGVGMGWEWGFTGAGIHHATAWGGGRIWVLRWPPWGCCRQRTLHWLGNAVVLHPPPRSGHLVGNTVLEPGVWRRSMGSGGCYRVVNQQGAGYHRLVTNIRVWSTVGRFNSRLHAVSAVMATIFRILAGGCCKAILRYI